LWGLSKKPMPRNSLAESAMPIIGRVWSFPKPLSAAGVAVAVAVAVAALAAGCGSKSETKKGGGLTVETVARETTTYEVPSSAMEPTLHCAAAPGCEAEVPDRVQVATPALAIRHGDVVAFRTPSAARLICGAGGIYIKRVIALPGDTWEERNGFVYINGGKLDEPYVKPDRRDFETHNPLTLADDLYFVMGDNRSASCDSRVWGPVPRKNIIGQVRKVIRSR
jgi:signal peptidase I